jgi:hypothetical protein
VKRAVEDQLRASLTEAIDNWWDGAAQAADENAPEIGDNTLALMAEAALAVLLAVADLQMYFEQNGLLKEE